MENKFYIAAGIDKDDNLYWLKNTDPVMWCDDKSECKRWLSLGEAKSDIDSCKSTFDIIFSSSNMKNISVYETDNNGNIYCKVILLKKKEIDL